VHSLTRVHSVEFTLTAPDRATDREIEMSRTATFDGRRWTVGAHVRETFQSYECANIDRAHLLLTSVQRLYAAVGAGCAIDTKRVDQLMFRLDRQRRGSTPA
jgi:hypothetical protein